MKRKLILTSLLSIAVLNGIVAGSTYALFTSEKNHFISVSTAKIQIESAIEESSIKTYSLGIEQEHLKFENTASTETAVSYDLSNNLLILNRMSPGDEVRCTLKISNASSIKTKYRVLIDVNGEIKDYLETSASSGLRWSSLEIGENPNDIDISVSIPQEVGNIAQSLSGTVTLIVESVQGNAFNAVNIDHINNQLSNGSDYIVLSNDIVGEESIVIENDVIVELENGAEIKLENDQVGDGVFNVIDGAELTLNGFGVVNGVCGNDYNMAVWANGGKVVINGGTYTNVGATDADGTVDDQYDLIYCKDGEIIINGGYFHSETPKWTINCNDKLPGTVTIYGGSFVNFDPSNLECEPQSWNDAHPNGFVAEGYTVVTSLDGEGNTVYTVVKDSD